MSRNNNNVQRKSVAPPCAHCRNLGLPTNHPLRQSADPKSPVVCPVLKNTQCLNCGDLGHTASHCKKGADEEAARLRNRALAERAARIRAIEEKKQSTAPTAPSRPKTGGLFAALDDSDDEADALRISNKKAKKAAKLQAATDAAEAAAKAIESSREATRYLTALLGVGKKTSCFASGPSVTVTGTMTLTKQSLSQMIASAPNPIKVYKRWTWTDAEESEDEDADDISCFSNGNSYRNR